MRVDRVTLVALIAIFVLGAFVMGMVYRTIGLVPLGYGVSIDEVIGLSIIGIGGFYVWYMQLGNTKDGGQQ